MQNIDWKTGLGVEIVAPKRPSLKAEINKLEKSVHKDIVKIMAMPPNWLDDRRFFKTQGGEPAGTTHTWKDGKKYQKQQNGTWKEVSSGKQDTKKEEGGGEGRKKEGGSGVSADQLREALKQYHVMKDKFNGGFRLWVGPKGGFMGGNYINEDGEPVKYPDSKTFESKEEVKQFIKDKIIPNLAKELAENKDEANSKKKEESKEPGDKGSAPNFDKVTRDAIFSGAFARLKRDHDDPAGTIAMLDSIAARWDNSEVTKYTEEVKKKIVTFAENQNKIDREAEGKKKEAPDFDDDGKLIEDGENVDFVETEEGPKIIGSPKAFEKEYANYKIDKTDKALIDDVNSGDEWAGLDLINAIKKRKDLWNNKKLTSVGEKAFIDILRTSDKHKYEDLKAKATKELENKEKFDRKISEYGTIDKRGNYHWKTDKG